MTARRASAFVTATTALCLAGHAYGGAFAVKERSTEGQGASFAGSSAGAGGLSSMGFNPAGIGMIDPELNTGELAGGLSLVLPIADGRVVTGGVATGETVEGGGFVGVANGYVGYRLDPDVIIGLSLYTPFGLTTKYDAPWTGQGDGLTSKLLTFQFSPTVAIEPLDGLTLAAQLHLLYAQARLTTSTLILEGDNMSAGFSVGALWQITDSTRIGLAYQHGYNLSLKGTATGPAVGGAVFSVVANAQLPATISAGIVQSITSEFRLMGEFQWQNWSVFDRLGVSIATPVGGIAVSDPQNYRDAFFVSFGGEYDVTSDFTFRAGVAWDQTPTSGGILPGTPPALGVTNRTVRVPDEDRLWLSVGGTYAVDEHMSLSLGYSYLHALNDPVVGLRTAPGSTVVYDGGAHVFSLGGSLKF